MPLKKVEFAGKDSLGLLSPIWSDRQKEKWMAIANSEAGKREKRKRKMVIHCSDLFGSKSLDDFWQTLYIVLISIQMQC